MCFFHTTEAVINIFLITPHLKQPSPVGWHQEQPDSAGRLDTQSREAGGVHQDLQVCHLYTLSPHVLCNVMPANKRSIPDCQKDLTPCWFISDKLNTWTSGFKLIEGNWAYFINVLYVSGHLLRSIVSERRTWVQSCNRAASAARRWTRSWVRC